MTLASVATFDVTFLVNEADIELGLSLSEINVMSYLACLMSVYDGQEVQQWGYTFSAVDYGAPFSATLAESIPGAVQAGWIVQWDRVYRRTDAGERELAFQVRLPTNSRRIRYLRASIAASLVMPLPLLGDALGGEPSLSRALQFLRQKQLLDRDSLELVDAQFNDLRAVVGSGGERADLMVPTVVWLGYLASLRRPEDPE